MGAEGATSVRTAIDERCRAAHPGLTAARRHLHAHPELSNREVMTAGFVAERLRAAGLDEVRTGIAGHGVVGVLRGALPGPRVVALRADMDALPVAERSGVDFASTIVDARYPGGPFPVAHACGHDCHTATVLTAAEVLASMRDAMPGTALFVFRPAEEGPPAGETGGAQAMLDAGALADPAPTMVFGMHVGPLPTNAVTVSIGHVDDVGRSTSSVSTSRYGAPSGASTKPIWPQSRPACGVWPSITPPPTGRARRWSTCSRCRR